MLSNEDVLKLIGQAESDRIEKKESIADLSKIAQTICAFSNDFANHNLPSYLLIGVNDKTGKPIGLDLSDNKLSDKILLPLGQLKVSGNILPTPSMNIHVHSLEGGDVVVVEVLPSKLPPVRYKGNVWIRTGPMLSLANESDEVRLTERRMSNFKTFDMLPNQEASLVDLNIEIFKIRYLPNAIDPEILENNHRDLKKQMASLRLYDLEHNCPTNAAILILGNNPKYFLPGAYVQYVRFSGDDLTSGVINEKAFSGDISSMVHEMDLFIKNNIEQKPVFVTALREEIVREYPFFAIRELLNNAVMHRDYSSNAPTKFYEFSDRIEISNPGGLYGIANARNFPHQNDYRNPVIAEALKILGYVNRFNIGITTAEKELAKNGNPPANFTYNLPEQFSVSIHKKTIS